MTINWYGHSCFRISNQGGRLTIITDPFDKSIGLTPPRVSADIVAVSHGHYDHNNIGAISGEPFVVEGPGEYEIRGAQITGINSFHDRKEGQERGANTIYVMEVDGIRVCHLGDLGQEKLTDKQLEAIGLVDVLMAPVGGNYTLGAKEAARVSNRLEPHIVIPMHYKLSQLKIDLAKVDDFLKEMGLEGVKPVDKITIKEKDLAGKKTEVVLMKI